jgi:hypothetical protein
MIRFFDERNFVLIVFSPFISGCTAVLHPLENVDSSEVFVIVDLGMSSSFGFRKFGFWFYIRLSQECSVQSSSIVRMVQQHSAAVCLSRRFARLFFEEMEVNFLSLECERAIDGRGNN